MIVRIYKVVNKWYEEDFSLPEPYKLRVGFLPEEGATVHYYERYFSFGDDLEFISKEYYNELKENGWQGLEKIPKELIK